MKFEVEVKEVKTKIIEVRANDPMNAEAIAKKLYSFGVIVLDDTDKKSVSFRWLDV